MWLALLLRSLLGSKWIAVQLRLATIGNARHTSKLLPYKGIVTGSFWAKSAETRASTVDERSWSRVLCGDSQVTSVSVSILTISRGQQSVQFPLVFAELSLRSSETGLLLLLLLQLKLLNLRLVEAGLAEAGLVEAG